jgi:hypothetical protein
VPPQVFTAVVGFGDEMPKKSKLYRNRSLLEKLAQLPGGRVPMLS